MVMPRSFGTGEKKAADIGPKYLREIRQVRTSTWAAVARAETEALQNDIRRQYLRSDVSPRKLLGRHEGWSAISEPRQKEHLAGTRHPQDRTIKEVAKHAPESRNAFRCVLWQMLSPKANVTGWMNTVTVFGENELEDIVGRLSSGQALDVAGRLADLRTTSALVAKARLLGHERDHAGAFDVGCALVQTLCFHAVNPLFTAVAQKLWTVVATGVLQGLHKGNFKFSRCLEGFPLFADLLWERRGSAEALYGLSRSNLGPRFSWATAVDMSYECIRGFATPDVERSDSLQSFLDCVPADRQITKALDNDPLFIWVRSQYLEEKCKF